MTNVAVSEARERLAELIDTTRRTGEPIHVTRRGRPIAVILDPDVYERLLDDAEDALDRAELHVARTEDDYVPWAEVKADLGLSWSGRLLSANSCRSPGVDEVGS